jgi:hypothetical protein
MNVGVLLLSLSSALESIQVVMVSMEMYCLSFFLLLFSGLCVPLHGGVMCMWRASLDGGWAMGWGGVSGMWAVGLAESVWCETNVKRKKKEKNKR